MAKIRNTAALASIRHLRVLPRVWRTWPARLQTIRQCMHCKNRYNDAGAAGRCEKWHEGV